MDIKTRKILLYLGVFVTTLFAACQGEPDIIEDTGRPPTLDVPPIEINLPSSESFSSPDNRNVIKEEVFGRWKILSLDEWSDGGHIWFTGDEAIFGFKCNEMSISGEMSDDGYWRAPSQRFATTEMLCAGERGAQDKAMISLMIGPTKIERIGKGPNKLRFFSGDHEMVIERSWLAKDTSLHEHFLGQWDVLRFDDFAPSSRLNGEGKRSAYVDFYDNPEQPASLRTGFHIGCNFSGNSIQLELESVAPQLVHMPRKLDRLTTQIGCTPTLQHRDEEFFAMMYKSPKIERLGVHRLRLWTENHELILEKSETGQARNRINKFDALKGNWLIGTVNKNGFGFGGPFYTPEVLVISKHKIQYGDHTPYLKTPRFASGGKITGEIVGGFGARDCERSRKLSVKNPNMGEVDVTCLVLDTLINHPIAEPINLPNHLQLTSDDYRITLQRNGTNTILPP